MRKKTPSASAGWCGMQALGLMPHHLGMPLFGFRCSIATTRRLQRLWTVQCRQRPAHVNEQRKDRNVNEHQQLAIKALEQIRGDDLLRARAAFRNCTPEEMGTKYGMSDQTRAEILAGYEAHDAKVTAALAWVMAQR